MRFTIHKRTTKRVARKRKRLFRLLISTGILSVAIFALTKLPTFLMEASTETLHPASILSADGWQEATVESLIENDTDSTIATQSNASLVLEMSDLIDCNAEINAIIPKFLAYSSQEDETISISFGGYGEQFKVEPSHMENAFSLHTQEILTKPNGERWACGDINGLTVTINTISPDQAEGYWQIDKFWIEIDYTAKKPEINQRSYRWQYSQDSIIDGISPDSPLFGVKVGEQLALRVQLDNTGALSSQPENYILQVAAKDSNTCDQVSVWENISDTSAISPLQRPLTEVATAETNSDTACGKRDCDGFVTSNWTAEKTATVLPQNYYTELGFTLDTINAEYGQSYCLRIVTEDKQSGENIDLNGKYQSYPEINFGPEKAVEFKKELKATSEPELKAEIKDFQPAGKPSFELAYFDLTDVSDPYLNNVIEEPRVLEIDRFKIVADVVDDSGQAVDFLPQITFAPDGHTFIELPSQNNLSPGTYTLEVSVEEKDYATFQLEQDFTWGVLAINTNKAVYKPGEKTSFLMTVLDEQGRTVCDADVRLDIAIPSGKNYSLTTKNRTIVRSKECAPNNFTYVPDYSADFWSTGQVGSYQVKMTATTPNGEKSLFAKFKVSESIDFDIERTGPVRIYPLSEYEMKLKVKPSNDFVGEAKEVVPDVFEIKSSNSEIQNSNNQKTIIWNVDWKAGETYELSYTFDAPDISPEFYLLGPMELVPSASSGLPIFIENRQWQIASDQATYTGKHLRSVEYTLGGGGGTAQYQTGTYNPTTALATNTSVWFGNQWNTTEATASTKAVKIAGDNIRVVSAYLAFSAQATSSANVTDVSISLDVNPGPSATVDVFLDTINRNSGIYIETSGQAAFQINATADATSLFQGQTDGQWLTGLAVHGLVRVVGPTTVLHTMKLTLTYEEDYTASANDQTKTIRLPLDSTDGTDTGTRQANCPVSTACGFTYDTTSRLQDVLSNLNANIYDAWFEINGIGDTTTTAGQFVNFTPTIDGGAAGSAHQTIEVVAADNVGFFVIYRPSIATNNFDPLVTASDTVNITTAAAIPLSGLTVELVITYAYSTGDADPQTETIRYYELMHTTNPTVDTYYAFTGAGGSTNVTISNTGLNVRNAWFKVQTSAVATSVLQVGGTVGASPAETNQAINLTSAQLRVGSSPVILNMTGQVEGGTDYFSSATTAVTGRYRWTTTTGSVAAAELWVTFTWTGSSYGTETKTNTFYATPHGGSQGATLVNTGVLAAPFAVELPETVIKTYRSAYMDVNVMHGQGTSLTANSTYIGVNQRVGTAIPMLTDSTSESFDTNFFQEISTTYFSDGSATISWAKRAFESSLYQNDDDTVGATEVLVVTYDAALGAITLNQNHYRWRDDSTDLNTTGGWVATEDNIPTINKTTTYRVRVEVANTGTAPAVNYPFRLEFAARTGDTCGDETFVAVPVTVTGTEHFEMVLSDRYVDQDQTTTGFLTVVGTRTNGRGVEDPANQTVAIDITNVYYTELEYAVQATTNAAAGGTYCFRVTNIGSVTNFSYSTYPQATITSGSNNPPNNPTSLAQKKTTDTVIALADWTDETSVKFTALADDTDNPDTLYLCIEADQLGTAFSDTEDSCGSGVAYSGTPVTVIHTLSGLTPGTQYHWHARVKDLAGAYSAWVAFGGNSESNRDFGVDNSAPGTGSVYDGSTIGSDADTNDGSLTVLYGNWGGFADAQSGVKKYQYAIGTTSGGTDIVAWKDKAEPGNLFSDEFESGDLTSWDATSIDTDDLYVSNRATYTGIWGLEANIDDGNAIYVQDNFTAANNYYVRFYLNPNSLTMTSGDIFTVAYLQSSSTDRASVELNYNGSNYRVRGVLAVGPQTTSWVNIGASSFSTVELRWYANASGKVSLWVDGVQYDSATGNTNGLTVDNIRLGMVSGRDAGTSGQFFIDKITSSNSAYNGPLPYFSETIVTAGHLHTGQEYFTAVRAVNNAEATGSSVNSDGLAVLPTFTVSLVPSSITFLDLNPGNSWTDTKTTNITTSTNAYHGYVTTIWTSRPLTNTLDGSYTIANYGSPNSAPTTWSGTGFGYTTTDSALSGGTANRFTSGGPKYAGFVTSGAGDPVCDHTDLVTGTTGAVSSEPFTITYKVAVNSSQAAGPYTAEIIYVATPTF